MNLNTLITKGYIAYSKIHEQGYPSEGYEIYIDGEEFHHLDDSDVVRIYNYDDDIVLELADWDTEFSESVRVFEVTKVEVSL